MYSHTSIYDDGWIKIFKGEGENRQKVIKVEEADDADLYNRAAEAVISWANRNRQVASRL